MKLARFRVNEWESYGVVEGDRVRVIQGDIFGDHKFTQASYPLEQVKLLPPTHPTGFWAVGLNYAAHVAHQEGALDPERLRRKGESSVTTTKASQHTLGGICRQESCLFIASQVCPKWEIRVKAG